ncbi:MAG TPA: TIGR00266 family protein [Myxococcota bacterium]|jgi:uncharacterized protein (TIGR00266 family)|nr:TIGR00266 family protein [Myxococcota bacterium]
MRHQIHYKPSFAMAEVDLEPTESLTVESGSMVAMTDNMQIRTTMGNTKAGFFGKLFGFFAALIRKMFGGESFFVNHYTPTGAAGKVFVAPAMAGDILHWNMQPTTTLMVEASSYLASTPGIEIKTVWGGLRSLFSGEGAFWLRITGTGDLWLNCYGAMKEIQVQGGYIIDTGHVVCFESTLNYKIKGAGGLKSTLFSGEGLVMHFEGNGRLWIQTRNLGALVQWLTPLLPA